MNTLSDPQLLRDAIRGSREALAEIATRYVGFVYQAAFRQVRDAHVAEDVTQAVFVILSKKINSLKPATVLHAWLFITTRFAANNALKLQARRTHHERKAAAMRHEMQSSAESNRISGLLDDALSELREMDRGAVLMSFFGAKSFREVGATIGISEEAARKRVTRAIDRMRQFFAHRGVEVGGAALVATMQSSAAASVPAGLIQQVTTSLLSASTSGAASGIAQGVIHMMTWMKIKFAAACAGIVAMSLTGTMLVAAAASQSASSEQAPMAQQAKASAPGPLQKSVRLDNRVRVELLGVAAVPSNDGKWWDAHGQATSAPCDERNPSALSDGGYQAAILVEAPKGSSIAIRGSPCKTSNTDHAQREGRQLPNVTLMEFEVEDGQELIDFLVRIGYGEFETLIDCETPAEGAAAPFGDGHVNLEPITDDGSNSRAVFQHQLNDHDIHVRAYDASGKEYEPIHQLTHDDGQTNDLQATFPVPADQVRRITLTARKLDKWAYFEKVTLIPDQMGESRVLNGNDPTTMPGR